MNIAFDSKRLPILQTSDVVVIGGSFGGVAVALALAEAGRKVTLVEPRTYLGREITATLRPWISVPAETDVSSLPPLIAACVEASNTSAMAGEIPLRMDAVKTCLEDQLLATGVKPIYASLPVGLCTVEDKLQGIIIGNKSGRQVLLCQVLIDATETALAARLTNAEFETAPSGLARFYRTLEFSNVTALDGQTLSVPEYLGFADNEVVLHSGYRESGHLLVECALDLPSQNQTALEITQRDVIARQKTIGLAAHLMAEVPAFQAAYFAATSHELYGPYTPRMAGPTPDWVHPLESHTVEVVQASVVSFAGLPPGVWCLNEAARVDEATQALLRDPVVTCRLGAALARVIDQHWPTSTSPSSTVSAASPSLKGVEGRSTQRLSIKEPEQPQRGRHYERYPVVASSIPVLRTADVLVVGGGTSGATAAITSAQEGMRTVLIEMNPGLGGTGTYGGIHSYWFGHRVGFAARVMALVDEMHDYLHHEKLKGPIPKWNIEAKIQALTQAAEEAGVEMLLNALFIGTIVQENVVRGVVAATRTGPVALLGDVVIDASGDGDVAAFAGADYVYGSDRDHVVMYSYMPQVAKPGRPRNVKTSMADVSNVEDYTRAILAERRRGEEGDHDHGIYVAPRESRHIKADLVLTLTDQLLKRCWPDTIYVAFSNHDIKGQTTSDWLLVGLIPPHLEIEIPYRALLPKGLENIMVVGKAFSATHDALAAPRMQPDLENLGGIAALAAAMAIRSGETLRTINVKALQAKLVEGGALPEQVLSRTLVTLQYTGEELEALVGSLTADRPLYAYSDMELNEIYHGRIPLVDICSAGPQVVPVLEKAHSEAEGDRRVLLAQALAMVGSTAGVPTLVSAIQSQLGGEHLPERSAHIRHVGLPPDQGAAADVVYLIYALGLARDRRILPIWQRVVDLLAPATEADIMDRHKSLFHYVTALCYGAERLGEPAAIPILKQLHRYPPYYNQVSDKGFQPDYTKERRAYLELVVGRALARCGSPDGFVILINYLNDVRALLAEHSHTELVAITGQDFGKDMAAWGQWLEAEGDNLKPTPWLQPSDPVMAWDELILTSSQK